MSLVRRLALGLPAAGVTAFAALAVSWPALASGAAPAAYPAVTASPDRGGAGYGAEQPATAAPTATVVTTPPAATTAPATTAPATTAPATTAPTTAAPTTASVAATGAAAASPDTVGGTRGHSGYGGASVMPTGGAQSVPGNGVDNETVPSPTVSKSVSAQGGGVSAGSLPLTGEPVGATITVGALLIAGGVGALWFTRRRTTA
jgi:LPXTG-motif cell wall-anchored protein